MDKILDRVNQAEKQISAIKNKVAYRDLRKMLANIDKTITALSQESVECRRLKKDTSKYIELKKRVEELLSILEQHITLAALIG